MSQMITPHRFDECDTDGKLPVCTFCNADIQHGDECIYVTDDVFPGTDRYHEPCYQQSLGTPGYWE